MEVEKTIIDLEKKALKGWSGGNAAEYFSQCADDYTYFDNLGATELVIGRENTIQYAEKMFSELPEHKYEMAGAHVQHYDNAAILEFQYHPFSLQGESLTKWTATSVYSQINGAWTAVHSHWTMLQNPS
jgi:lipopolysaccharide export system protein LptC